jgi:hypothetical protein
VTEAHQGKHLYHGKVLSYQKWAGRQDGTECRVTRYHGGLCFSLLDYERGELLAHMDLLTSTKDATMLVDPS